VSRVVVIGVGNPYRGDDAAGLTAAERLESRVPDGVSVLPCEQEPTRIIDTWRGARAAVIVDAVVSGVDPGTLHRVDASREPVPAHVFRSSTHAFGVGETIELARALGRLPQRIVVYGVEGATFAAGVGLTPQVETAVDRVVEAVLGDLEHLVREEEPCTNEH
jgi:hydrogenase maturation protease